ncbi:MAG: MaoC family dehydratase N-terminal domain-containing protein [Acetobacteraceae bacterium]
MSVNYITDDVKAVIGAETELVVATHPVEASEVRRFHHATMDAARRYWDADWAAASRYGGVVAPPAFPTHAFRRKPDSPDRWTRWTSPISTASAAASTACPRSTCRCPAW